MSLPWSTSATGILLVVWLVALLPTLDVAALRRELWTPAGGLPVLLWLLALVGMLWAVDVPFKERVGGLGGYHKLLLIPLFMLQFRRSPRAGWVIIGYLAACGALLVMSYADLLLSRFPSFPQLPIIVKNHSPGIVVKDYITQGGEFVACAMFLAPLALLGRNDGRRRQAIFALLAALCFLANVIYIGLSRTALVTAAALLVLFAWKFLSWGGRFALLAAVIAAGALSWPLTENVRANVSGFIHEIRIYRPNGEITRSGERLVYWQKSLTFVRSAPLIGHGTGSIRDQFRRAAEGQTGMAAEASANPHNQTFAVAIQLGAVGVALLIAMWLSHLQMFRGSGLAAWFGLVVVAQNIIGSMFNSHLLDFTQGWSYVVGVGVAGGVMMKRRSSS
jgi:hypothetical protein